MNRYVITGGKTISGEIACQGAKNSVLPIIAAATMCDSPCTLKNCPEIRDVAATLAILRHLGCEAEFEGGTLKIGCELSSAEIPDALMREMRSSIILLGALLSKHRRANISFPGGCELGPRPIDLHIASFRKMGVKIEERHGSLICDAEKLHGAYVHLDFPSVGATENIMLLAARAKGRTVVENAAKEPEIEDLQGFLNACGARVSGAGTSVIVIDGVAELHGAEYAIMPDRIVAATYLAAAAITGGTLTVTGVEPSHLGSIVSIFERSGCELVIGEDRIALSREGAIRPVGTVRTMPYPGFPTDALAPVMAYLSLAKGSSVFFETIFQNRYKHAAELMRMGAAIKVQGSVAVVEGVRRLSGAKVMATDLRGGAALVIAALAAEGESEVTGIELIKRGYEKFDSNLRALGAQIEEHR